MNIKALVRLVDEAIRAQRQLEHFCKLFAWPEEKIYISHRLQLVIFVFLVISVVLYYLVNLEL